MALDYLARRTAGTVALLLLVVFVTLVILHLAPGDPAIAMLGEHARQEDIQAFRGALGLDLPLLQQYARYLSRAIRGDLGESIRFRRPALAVVAERLPASLTLAFAGFAIAVAIGLPLGIAAAVRPGTRTDRAVLLLSTAVQSVPGFWLGAILIVVFAVHLGILPTSGAGTPAHLVLPAITLSTAYVGLTSRMARQSLREVLASDYVRTARAKGLPERRVILGHALRNALLPVVTVLGLQLGQLVGGAIVTEGVFAWPGVGSAAIIAIHNRDYPVVQAVVLLTAVAIVVVNLIVDVLYHVLDPRIQLG